MSTRVLPKGWKNWGPGKKAAWTRTHGGAKPKPASGKPKPKPASGNKKKDPKMVAAGKKAWLTRQRNQGTKKPKSKSRKDKRKRK